MLAEKVYDFNRYDSLLSVIKLVGDYATSVKIIYQDKSGDTDPAIQHGTRFDLLLPLYIPFDHLCRVESHLHTFSATRYMGKPLHLPAFNCARINTENLCQSLFVNIHLSNSHQKPPPT